jgi:hypothetical protein
MVLYYHHVGLEGAALHYESTIFKKVKITDIKKFIPDNMPSVKAHIYEPLKEECQDELVNCWGVPEGAYYKIQDLWAGDYVILIEHLHSPLLILSEVIAYQHQKFPQLSEHLWGRKKYPYIFFIKWNWLNLDWPGLCKLLGYALDYNPQGLFLNVSKDALALHGGIGNFMYKLEKFIIKN